VPSYELLLLISIDGQVCRLVCLLRLQMDKFRLFLRQIEPTGNGWRRIA
jgi:hypothetical protein